MDEIEELLAKRNDHIKWTKQEIAEWIKGLELWKKEFVLDALEDCKERGFDLHLMACLMRTNIERIEQEPREPTFAERFNSIALSLKIGDFLSKY